MKTPRSLVLLCFALLLVFVSSDSIHSSISSAQQNNSFTLEQVLSSPFPSDLVAAPTGERIAWVFDAQGKRNVWVAEGPDFKSRQLTQYNEDTGQEITELSFTHDGKWLVYVRGGNENSAGEVPNPTSDPSGATQAVYAVSWDKGRVIKLAEGDSPVVSPTDNRVVFSKENQIHIVEIAGGSEPHQLFAARGSSLTPRWSPDGKKLAFNSSRNTHSLIGVYDFEKQTIKYLSPSIDRDSAPRWSLDGKRIAFIRQPTRGNQPRLLSQDTPDPWAIRVADAATGEAREIWRSGNQLNDSFPRMAGANVLNWAAGDRLVFSSEMDGWMRIYSISGMGGEVKCLAPAGPCEWEQMTFTPDKREIVYSSNCADIDRRHLRQVSVDGGQQFEVTVGKGIQWSPAITASAKQIAFLASTALRPATVCTLQREAGKGLRYDPLGSDMGLILGENQPYSTAEIAGLANKDFEPAMRNLVIPEQVIFKAADGLDIHGQLFLPKGVKPNDKLPAVIFMHGGPPRQMFLGWHNMYYYHNSY